MRCRLDRGLARRDFSTRRVEACCFGERMRIDGAKPVNDIEAEEQRNLQTGFLCCDSLELPGIVRSEYPEERSDSPGAHHPLTALRGTRSCRRSKSRACP